MNFLFCHKAHQWHLISANWLVGLANTHQHKMLWKWHVKSGWWQSLTSLAATQDKCQKWRKSGSPSQPDEIFVVMNGPYTCRRRWNPSLPWERWMPGTRWSPIQNDHALSPSSTVPKMKIKTSPGRWLLPWPRWWLPVRHNSTHNRFSWSLASWLLRSSPPVAFRFSDVLER